jgi:hypothetical protein
MCSTFGMFTNGLKKFDDAYKAGYFNAAVHDQPDLSADGASDEAVLPQLRSQQIHRADHRHAEPRLLHQLAAGAFGTDPEGAEEVREERENLKSQAAKSELFNFHALFL